MGGKLLFVAEPDSGKRLKKIGKKKKEKNISRHVKRRSAQEKNVFYLLFLFWRIPVLLYQSKEIVFIEAFGWEKNVYFFMVCCCWS